MTLKSMTGFGRADGLHGPVSWTWEVRSVNGRGLDLRLRVAPGFESLEPRVRELLQARLARGSVTASLTVRRSEGQVEIRVNPAALDQAIAAARQVRARVGGQEVSVDALLGVRGVLEFAEPVESEAEVDARAARVLATLDEAIEGLVQSRAAEGARLAAVLHASLDAVERECAAIAASPARSREAAANRLAEQLQRLLPHGGGALDPARLHQEAAILATRGDIEEELKRLSAHVMAARELMASAGAAGRKLDFLTQELNREANTLCAKSSDVDVTRHGLELKALIDQMREQIQNIE